MANTSDFRLAGDENCHVPNDVDIQSSLTDLHVILKWHKMEENGSHWLIFKLHHQQRSGNYITCETEKNIDHIIRSLYKVETLNLKPQGHHLRRGRGKTTVTGDFLFWPKFVDVLPKESDRKSLSYLDRKNPRIKLETNHCAVFALVQYADDTLLSTSQFCLLRHF